MAILKRKTKTTDVAAPAEAEVKEAKPAKKVAKKVEKKATETSTTSTKTVSRFAAETVLAPLVTEKAARLNSQNVMVFRVAPSATRVAVGQAIKELYNVTPVKVNMISVRGKDVRRGRSAGRTRDWKKAMVTLPKGARIDVFAS
jgi:large subunit ribosomal protein L23